MIALFHFYILPILQTAEEIDPADDGFSPLALIGVLFVGVMALITLVALFVLVVAGIIVGLLAFAALTGIGIAGVAANAVVTGLVSRSPRAGLAALVLQFGAVLGLVFGLTACLAVRWLLGYTPFEFLSVAASGVSAAALGAGLAWVSFRLVVACCERIKARIRQIKMPGALARLSAGSQVPAGPSELPFR